MNKIFCSCNIKAFEADLAFLYTYYVVFSEFIAKTTPYLRIYNRKKKIIQNSKIFCRKGEPLPEFGSMATNVTVQREDTAFLHCPVKRFGDRAVSYPQVMVRK